MDRRGRYGLVVLVVLAFALRVWAALDDFWLDEIIAYNLSLGLDSAWDAIFTLRIENHLLNTIFVYLLGERENWVWYRLLSIVTGVGVVALMAVIGRRRGPLEAYLAAALGAFSYPLIQYASESRGYAPAAFFSLLAFLAVERFWERRGRASLVLYWAAAVLAVLSHPTSIFVVLSIGLWSLVHERRASHGTAEWLRRIVTLHAVPMMVIVLLHILVFRAFKPLGGPIFPMTRVLRETMSLAVGMPPAGVWSGIGVVLFVVLLIACLISLPDGEPGLRIFFAAVIVFFPAALLALSGRNLMYIRYFLVCFPFFYLLLARAAPQFWNRSRGWRWACSALLVVILAGNLHATAQLIRFGRGQYHDAMLYMAERSAGPLTTVGGDHDFRTSVIIEFYRRYLPAGVTVEYVNADDWPAAGTEWFIVHILRDDIVPAPRLTFGATGYTLEKRFPFAGLSGFHWYVYRRETAVEPTSRIGSGNEL